jgi:hypothetical protein
VNKRRQRGSVALMLGLALPAVIAMVALGTEITLLLYKQRQIQTVADAAALGGATALQSGHPVLGVEARGIASYLGFVDGGTDGTTVTVNNPPLSGSQANSTSAVEVIIAQPQTLYMTTLFYTGQFSVGARAVAIIGTGSYCVLQLDSGSANGFSMKNGAVANLAQCGVAVNSTDQAALFMSGTSQLNAQSVSVSGGTSISGGASVNPASALKSSQAAVPDPYAAVAMPAFSGCANGTSKSYGHGTWILTPGVYCQGVSFKSDANVTMNSGVYFIDRGSFDVGGSVTLTGAGVTIVLTSSTGTGYATATAASGATVTLSAPTSGTTAGIVFFGDRRAPLSNVNDLGGGATINLTGAIYLPTQNLLFQNGANNSSSCTELIAGTMQLKGSSKLQINCPTGVAPIGATSSSLVE